MHWVRGESLGEGSYGIVSKAMITQKQGKEDELRGVLPAVFAVKSAELMDAKSLMREKKMLDRFKNCPSVVGCLGSDTTNEKGMVLYNIFLEYASAGCLDDRIIRSRGGNGKGGLDEHLVGHYTGSILLALRHIHNLGFVHCDVKPQNVLLFREPAGHEGRQVQMETAKLADFGSTLNLNDEEEDGVSFQGLVRGTLVYAAPESVSNREYTPASDVWALGCTVLKMLTARSPWNFTGTTKTKDVVAKIGCMNGDVPEIPATVSRKAQDFLRKCLVKDPRRRWSVDELLDHPFISRHQRRRSLSRGLQSMLHRLFHLHHDHGRAQAIRVHGC